MKTMACAIFAQIYEISGLALFSSILVFNTKKTVNILAIDTSTEACSVALLREDGQIFSEFELAPRQHTRLLPAMMEAVLKSSGKSKQSLTYCAFANGPGAFTGIRIAAATVQGIAIGLHIPVVQISTLATLAQTCFDKHRVDSALIALDARMGEVYWAKYKLEKSGLATLDGDERLSKIEHLVIDSAAAMGVGHGWQLGGEIWKKKFVDHNPANIDADLLPDAAALVKLARQAVAANKIVEPENISINYLRNKVAEKSRR